MLITELRRSPMAPLALVLVLVGAWQALFSAAPSWLGRAQDTQIVLGTFGTLIVGPAAIACACWTVHRAERAGLADVVLLGGRSPVAKLGLPAVAVWCWASLAELATMAMGLVRTWHASGATPNVLLLVLPVGVLALEVAYGVAVAVLLGRSLVVTIVAPLAFYAFYFVAVADEMSRSGWRRLLPVIQESWDPLYVADTWRLLLALLFVVAAAIALVQLSVVARFRRLPRKALEGAPLVVALVAGLIVTVTPSAAPTSYYAQQRSGADRSFVCQARAGLRVCVWEPDAAITPRLLDALDRALRSHPTDGLPRTLTEEGIAVDAGEGGPVGVISPPGWGAPATEVAEVVLAGMGAVGDPGLVCHAADRPASVAGGEPSHFYDRVLSDRLGLSVPYVLDDDVVATFEALGVPTQNTWLAAARAALATCGSVPPLPLPAAS